MKLPKLLLMAGIALTIAVPAQAEMVEFNFPITVSQEVPAPTIPYPEPLEPSGAGFVALDTDTNLLEWEIHYAGLTGDLAGAHFHGPAEIGATAGVQVPISGTAGSYGTLTGSQTISESQETDLLAGLWYVNLHTELNQPGEIRGQVLTEPIPEPAVMSVLGLGGLLVLRRRKKATA